MKKEFRVPSSALPRTSDGQLLVFGPYDEEACRQYMQDNAFVVQANISPTTITKGVRELQALWQDRNPHQSWQIHLMQGQARHSEDRRAIQQYRLLAGGGLDAENSASNYDAQNRKAMQLASGSGGIIYTAAFFKKQSALSAVFSGNYDAQEFTPLAQAAFDAMFARHTQGVTEVSFSAWLGEIKLGACVESMKDFKTVADFLEFIKSNGGFSSSELRSVIRSRYKIPPGSISSMIGQAERQFDTDESRLDAMSEQQLEAWIKLCGVPGRGVTVSTVYGDENGIVSHDAFIRYYRDAAEFTPKAVWRDLILHDFGYDMRPMSDSAELYWVEPKSCIEEASRQAIQVGSRVEIELQSSRPESEWLRWRHGTVVELDVDVMDNNFKYSVQCDLDAEGSLTYCCSATLLHMTWATQEQLFGWTPVSRQMNEELEQSYHDWQTGSGPSKLNVRDSVGVNMFDLAAMTCESMNYMLDSSGALRLYSAGYPQRLRRREEGENENSIESESALPGGIGGLLQNISKNLSSEQRAQFLGGFTHAASHDSALGSASVQCADEELVDALLPMGFTEAQARKACIATRNRSADEALEWLFAHPDESEAEAEQHLGGVMIEEVPDEAARSRSDTERALARLPSVTKEAAKRKAAAIRAPGPGAPEGVVQQLTSLQQQPTSKVRVYLGSEVLQKVADTKDLLPPASPTLVRHLSLQRAPALQRAISGGKDAPKPPILDRAMSAPAKLAVDWSRAWGSPVASSGNQGYPSSME